MKKTSVLLLVVTLLFRACGTKENEYEKAIANYVQTDCHGT